MIRKYLSAVKQLGDGRWGFDDRWTTGKRIQVRRQTKKEALAAHVDLSVLIANGRKDLAGIDQIRLAKFAEWERSQQTSISVNDLRTRFLDSKKADRQLNPGYVYNLGLFTGYYADEFGQKRANNITTAEFRAFLDELHKAARHRNNVRDAIVAMYRFGRDEKLLPDVRSAVEQVKRFKIKRATTILLYSPKEFEAIVTKAPDELLKFYAISGFAGVRPEEIRPRKGSPKDPLRWEDFRWREGYINLRDETTKTGIGRHVPILPALRSFLAPYRNERGPVLDYWPGKKLDRLFELTGVDHKKNAARHSFGTYRHAIRKRILELVEEMGTSISQARKRYVRPIPAREAKAFFSLRLREKIDMIQFPQSHNSHTKTRLKGHIRASR